MGPSPLLRKTSLFVPYHDRTDYDKYDFVVQRILSKDKSIRSCRLNHPIRAELELEVYGRQKLESLKPELTRSVLYLTFIDGFGLYCNNYRSLMGNSNILIYNCLNLPFTEN